MRRLCHAMWSVCRGLHGCCRTFRVSFGELVALVMLLMVSCWCRTVQELSNPFAGGNLRSGLDSAQTWPPGWDLAEVGRQSRRSPRAVYLLTEESHYLRYWVSKRPRSDRTGIVHQACWAKCYSSRRVGLRASVVLVACKIGLRKVSPVEPSSVAAGDSLAAPISTAGGIRANLSGISGTAKRP